MSNRRSFFNFLSILLSLCLAFGSSFLAYAIDKPLIIATINQEKESIRQLSGKDFYVNYRVKCPEKLFAGQGVITYNPDVLTLNTIEFPNIESGLFYNSKVAGTMKFNFQGIGTDNKSGAYDFTSEQIFVKIQFSIKGEVNSNTNIDLSFQELDSFDTQYVINENMTEIGKKIFNESSLPEIVFLDSEVTQPDTDKNYLFIKNNGIVIGKSEITGDLITVVYTLEAPEPIMCAQGKIEYSNDLKYELIEFPNIANEVQFNPKKAGLIKFNFLGIDNSEPKGAFDFSKSKDFVKVLFKVNDELSKDVSIDLIIEDIDSYTNTYVENCVYLCPELFNTENISISEVCIESSQQNPTEPSSGTTPTNPSGTTKPTEPSSETTPTNPSETIEPTESSSETTPTNPSGTTEPTEPSSETTPTNPSETIEPTESSSETTPTNPSGTTELTDPTIPTNSSEATEPTESSSETTPTNPSGTTEPTKPSSETTPTNPSGTTEPKEPSSETKPTNPSEVTKPTEIPMTSPTKQPTSSPVGAGTTVKDAEKAIIGSKSDEIAGAEFQIINAHATKTTKTSITLKWKRVPGSTKYIIYGNKCGRSNKFKKLASTTATSYKVTKIESVKIKNGSYYKFVVMAIKGKKVKATSTTIHIATTGGKYTNAKSIKTNTKNNRVNIKLGKNFKLRASYIKVNKNSKCKKHRTICYETTNKNIATVTKTGKITAKKKGTCYIYVFAQNGIYKRIEIKVN